MIAQASIQAPAQRRTGTLMGQWMRALIGTIFLLWVLFYPAGLLLHAIIGGVLVLAVAAGIYHVIGALQQPLAEALYPTQAAGWRRRTLVGGVLALLVLVGALGLLSAVYGGGPVTDRLGPFLIQGGDQLQIGWTLAAWALAGAVLGLVQWGKPRGSAAWTWAGMSAAGWAAAALLNWALFRHLVVGYDQIGF